MRIPALIVTLAPLCLAAERGLPPLGAPARHDSVREIVARAQQVRPVSLRIYFWSDSRFDLFETQRLIHLSGGRDGDRFSFDGWVEDQSLSFMAHAGGGAGANSFQFWGERVNLTLRRDGALLRAQGVADGRRIDLTLDRAGDGFSVRGDQGVDLDIRRSDKGYIVEGLIDGRHLNGYCVAVLGGIATVASTIK